MASDYDELISAYIDGQMSEPERATFEARLQVDAILRRRVMATQLLTREARQLSAAPVPRNFILPRDVLSRDAARARKPERAHARRLFPALVFRFGSIAAALLFVFLVGQDILQTSSSRTPTATEAPAIAPMSAPAPMPTFAPVVPTVADLASNTAALEAPAGPNPAMVTVLPMATLELSTLPAAAATEKRSIPQSSVLSAEADSADGAESAQANTFGLTATPQPDQPSTASAPTPLPALTVAPGPAPAAEQSPPAFVTPLFTVPRVLAAFALLLAIGLGIFGWARRE